MLLSYRALGYYGLQRWGLCHAEGARFGRIAMSQASARCRFSVGIVCMYAGMIAMKDFYKHTCNDASAYRIT